MFWGHTPEAWAAIGTWVYAGLTLTLAIAAIYAGCKVAEQIRNDRQHHKEQMEELKSSRESQLMPVVIVEASGLQRPEEGLWATGLTNIGAGPALELKFKIWIDPFEEPEASQIQENPAARLALEDGARNGTRPPTVEASVYPLPAGRSANVFWTYGKGSAARTFALIELEYRDVFGNPLPQADARFRFTQSELRSP